MDEVKLLPCPTPWCAVPEPYVARVGAHLYKARCKYCQVETDAQFNEAVAIEIWNTRPTLVTGQLDSRPLRVIGHSTAGPLYETPSVGEGIFIASDGTLRVAKTGDAHPQPGPSK